MLIDHDHKFIFVHVPRTGGTSIEKSLALALGIEDWRIQNGTPEAHLTARNADGGAISYDESTAKLNGLKHASAKELREFLGPSIWDRYFKFAVVRNPWDRTLSVWLKKLRSWNLESKPFIGGRTAFSTALLAKYRFGGGEPDLQVDFLGDGNGLIMDRIIRFEDLESGFSEVCREIGVDAKLLDNNDRTKHAHYREYFTDAARDIIADKKRRDIEQFGYEF